MKNQKFLYTRVRLREDVEQQLRVVAAQQGFKSVAEFLRAAAQEKCAQSGVDIDLSAGLTGWGGARKSEDD